MSVADEKIAPGEQEASASPARRRRPSVHDAERFALPTLLVLLLVVFSLMPEGGDTFISLINIRTVLSEQSVVTLLVLALLFPLVAGYIDFSVAAVATLASVGTASAMSDHDLPVLVAVLVGIALGLLVGLVNGVLIARLKLNGFITTLAMATLLGGLVQWYTGSVAIVTGISPSLTAFGSLTWFGVPRILFLVALAAVVVWYVLTQTPLGRRLAAVGANPHASRLVGVDVESVAMRSFLIAGAVAGLAGAMIVARTGSATVEGSTSLLFPALAAVFLGATAITPGRPNVLGAVIGVLFVAFSVNGLTLAGVASWVDPVFNGAALLVAIGLSTYLSRKRGMTVSR
ncbi:ABC transporter permease [Modestobacter sp. I12A-02628]|uniref:ABC transporter permease n=1 Tax=Goekera deserti TaxID=2497753 RepID=A0A7K3WFY0_9ACTN|nr:ABC transporter permease [Goekera deserti]MPQ99561.1 ABC transporter permease [Goekera deserti]NDI46427.1 ABC transporter permease [Goekera deserti]NEL54640.1 ABC transporter permease [Goekera deserti]